MRVTLKIFEGGREILTKPLEEGTYKVGRADSCDVVLPGEMVSRLHVEIRLTATSVYMTNVSSGGKVALNGRPTETAQLQNGDELLIGKYKIVVYHGVRDESTGPRIFEKEDLDFNEQVPVPSIKLEGRAPPSSIKLEEKAPYASIKLEEKVPYASIKLGEQRPLADVLVQNPTGPVSPFNPLQTSGAVVAVVDGSTQGSAALNLSETQVQLKPLVAKLIFTKGPKAEQEILFETFEITFGRSKKADIFLDDEQLSRIHAKISRVGQGYRLIDLDSHNGTYVNGMRILEHPLASYDIIGLGHSEIKFLIQDVMSEGLGKAGGFSPDQTNSLALDTAERNVLQLELERPSSPPPISPEPAGGTFLPFPGPRKPAPSPVIKIILVATLAILLIFYLLPGKGPEPKPEGEKPTSLKDTVGEVKLTPALPKEYLELSPENQRLIEGYYNAAIETAKRELYEESIAYLKKIHDAVPYYKQSRDFQEEYSRKLKELQILEAQEKIKRDDTQDLTLYLEEGSGYLRVGDFDRAAEAFNSAIAIDPNNPTAMKGLKAAEYKIKDINQVPPDIDPEEEKKQAVKELFRKALIAFSNKSYQEAIDMAEQIRKIELKGETAYLNEAKQIIDRARMLQKEEFEPFIIQAKEKFAEGDYNASRDLCEEMSKRDPAYEEANECLLKARKQLNRLAKEAYTHGYILESMNKIEEAKQFWSRGKNYVRPGDEYYDKIIKKLENYQ